MKPGRSKRLVAAGLTTIGIVAFAGAAPRADTIDRVLAVVSGELILLSDVTLARELGLVTPPAGADDPVRAVLSLLIDRALIRAEVDRYAPADPPADEIARQVAVLRQRSGSEAAFTSTLERGGIDERRLWEILRDEWRVRAYLDQRFTPAPPTEADVARYYEAHPSAFTRDGGRAPLDAVRSEVIESLAAERRAASVGEWVAGLRRRAEIAELYQPVQN